jgi:hypothetical protein
MGTKMSESKKELIDEHERLVGVLRSQKPKQLKAEYDRQKKELDELKDSGKYIPVNKAEEISPMIVRGVFGQKPARITHAFESKGKGWCHSGQPNAEPRPLHALLNDVKEDGKVESLDLMREGGEIHHKKELEDMKRLHVKPLEKSGYGPKGADLYDPAANQKRKENNIDTVEGVGQNKNVKRYTSAPTGTAHAQAVNQAQVDAAKNKKQPVKTLKDMSPEEVKALEAQYNTNVVKKTEDAMKRLQLLKSMLDLAIEAEKTQKGAWRQPSDAELFGHLITAPSVAAAMDEQWNNPKFGHPAVNDKQIAEAQVSEIEEV